MSDLYKEYIYFGQLTNAHDLCHEVYKIGATRQTPEQRLKNFQRTDPSARFFKTWAVKDCFYVESIIKQTFKNPMHGFILKRGDEWFQCPNSRNKMSKFIKFIDGIVHDFGHLGRGESQDWDEDLNDSDHENDEQISNDPNYRDSDEDKSEDEEDKSEEEENKSEEEEDNSEDEEDEDEDEEDEDEEEVIHELANLSIASSRPKRDSAIIASTKVSSLYERRLV
jgi:hypothetical protein